MPEKVVIEKLDGLKLLLVKVYMKHSRLNVLVLYVSMMTNRNLDLIQCCKSRDFK